MYALSEHSYPTRFYPRAHPTHIYVSHVIQILKNPPEYTMQNRVQSGRNTKNITHAHLLGIARELHEFHVATSQNFTPYNSQSVVRGTQCTLPKLLVTTRYSRPKMCDTFCQDCILLETCLSQVDQGCIRLNWSTTIEMHIIDTQHLHYLKYKTFCFDRNLHLFVPNSL